MRDQTPLAQCISVLEQTLCINPGFASVILGPLADAGNRRELEHYFTSRGSEVRFTRVGDSEHYLADVRSENQKGMARELTSVQVEACKNVLELLLHINNKWANIVLAPLKHESTRLALEHIFAKQGYVVEFYNLDAAENIGIVIRLPKDGKQAHLPRAKTMAASMHHA